MSRIIDINSIQKFKHCLKYLGMVENFAQYNINIIYNAMLRTHLSIKISVLVINIKIKTKIYVYKNMFSLHQLYDNIIINKS